MHARHEIIRVSNLSVKYGDRLAVGEIDLVIHRHEVLAIVGPSGCGKSSFLLALNRLTDLVPKCAVAGDVSFDGEDTLSDRCDLIELRRRIGMVFQKANPFPLSIRRNLSLPLWEHGASRAEIKQRSESALKRVGLWNEVKDRLDQSALKLSGGQQQRLCIARALALEPEILLMDEPCSALDPDAAAVIEDLISELSAEVTIVLVTHNLAQAKRIADRLALFWAVDGCGRLIETGSTADMFSRPKEKLTTDYLSGRQG